ncbi:heme A synthase [Kangiella profundi]|uniref:Heme A synthase n=1 Tax=Kangiella profundi TaxID=1561924 RepID=A0A2K9AAI1_9GAMM|nr:COX15/CtaA family protein [Kangiella profundi]AUD79730.1 heme A synthase [Kangiella profundi]GGE95890.1 cytochrome b561 [Kangiella profundi]
MQKKTLRKFAIFASILALCVILLGAWTRLSDAGLGCPDWPGCYGHFTVPQDADYIKQAEVEYNQVFEADKAWPEMIHRHFAKAIGLVIIILFVGAWRGRRKDPSIPVLLPSILLPLVIFQGLLGMWTVTLKVHPFVVMLHLLGGFSILSLLFLYILQLRPKIVSLSQVVAKKFKKLAMVSFVLVILQIALGGWTAANYAATACTELPFCNDGWTQNVDFKGGYDLWQKGFEFDEFKALEQEKFEADLAKAQGEPFINYEGGVLSHEQKVAIHVSHRIGAYIVFLVVGLLAFLMIREKDSVLIRHFGRALALVLIGQMLLGFSNIIFALPLYVAVAHNGGGVILLLTLIAVNFLVNWQFRQAKQVGGKHG